MEEYGAAALSTQTNSFGERYIFELNQNLFDSIDSHTVFSQNFNQNEFQPDCFYVVGGTDSGLLIRFFLGVDIPASARVVFVELPEVIDWLRNNNLPELPDNVSVVDYADLDLKLEEFSLNSYILQDKLYYIQSLGVQYCFYKPYGDFSTTIHDQLKTLHWNIRIDLDQQDFIIGQLENVAENQIPCSKLYNRFKGSTAVLLAGGPSLDDILPWVVLNRDKLVVIAVSRIAKQLLKHNVAPDFFVTVHTQSISFDVSKEMLLFSKDSILLNHAQACPQLISQWQGKSFFLGHILPWESDLNGPSKDLIGPTVSHAAYEIILRMGFRKIILGGVDLCYSQKNKSHAQGSFEADLTVQAEGGDVKIETNDGHLAETTFAFQRGILEFGRMALQAKNQGRQTINPSLFSAKIQGVDVVALNDIQLGNDNQLSKFLQDNQGISPSELQEYYNSIIQELSYAINLTTEIRRRALQGFQTASLDHEEALQDQRILICKDIIEDLNQPQLVPILTVIKSYGIHFFNSLRKPHTSINSDKKNVLEFYRLYFTAIIVSSDRLKSPILRALKRTNSRIEELAEQPDINCLITQWQEDGQPGRATIFKAKRTDILSSISENHLTLLQQLRDEFNETISTSEQNEDKAVWTKRRIHKLRNRILNAFNLKDKYTLANLISSLTQEDSAFIAPYFSLAKGLFHEIQEEPQEALHCYNQVVEFGEECPRDALEDSLSRIASLSISLNDLHNAQLALQCLADLSIEHMPTYAEFLYLAGEKDLALDIYADYLGKAPEDLKTMLKLGQIYKEMESKDGVKMIVDYVLERDPNNQTALNLKNSI